MNFITSRLSATFTHLQQSDPIILRLVKKNRIDWITILTAIGMFYFGFSLILITGHGILLLLVVVWIVPFYYTALIVFPAIIAGIAASKAGYDAETEAYEVMLTVVSSTRLLWNHILAVVYKLRMGLIVLLGLMPVFIPAIGLYMLTPQVADGMPTCVYSPLRIEYCGPWTSTSDTLGLPDSLLDGLQLFVATTGIAIGVSGIFLLSALSTIGIAFRWRSRVLAFTGGISLSVILGVIVAIAVPEIMFWAAFPYTISNKIQIGASSLLMATIPYTLVFLFSRYFERWVRA